MTLPLRQSERAHTDFNIIICITKTLASVAPRVIFTHLLSSVVHFGSVIVYIPHKLSGKTVLFTSFFHAPFHCACSSVYLHTVALPSSQRYPIYVAQVERVHACLFRERLVWNVCVFFVSYRKFTESVHISPQNLYIF